MIDPTDDKDLELPDDAATGVIGGGSANRIVMAGADEEEVQT